MTFAISSYHLLGFERHAANFLLANLQPSSVLKVAYCLLSVLNWWSLLFLAIINDVIYWPFLLDLGFCLPSFLLVQQEGRDGIQWTQELECIQKRHWVPTEKRSTPFLWPGSSWFGGKKGNSWGGHCSSASSKILWSIIIHPDFKFAVILTIPVVTLQEGKPSK